jgi:hypothetical protein
MLFAGAFLGPSATARHSGFEALMAIWAHRLAPLRKVRDFMKVFERAGTDAAKKRLASLRASRKSARKQDCP